MEIWDLTELKRDDKQNKLYDLFAETQRRPGNLDQYDQYIVQEDEEMRIDLVCNRIYGNVDKVGFLLFLNEISNPLNIRKGDVIRYANQSGLDNFKVSPQDENVVPEILAKVDKSTRKDPNREEFEKNNYTIPPNLQETPTPPFQIRGDTVIIGG